MPDESATSASRGHQAALETMQSRQTQFDHAISLSLGLWEALSTAVANGWGGPDSADKRDWFAGAVSDLFLSRPDTDEEELECVLLQVMEDEFDVRLEDETEVEVAAQICRIRRSCNLGDFSEIDRLQQRWASSRDRRQEQVVVQEPDHDVNSDEEDDDSVENGDTEMSGVEAPQLAPAKAKIVAEVDEDGFTKVVGKRR